MRLRTRCVPVLLLCAFLFSGCASVRSVNEDILVNLYASQRQKPKDHPVIFIPGMMGSVLMDSRKLYEWAAPDSEYGYDDGSLQLISNGPVLEVRGTLPVYR